METMTTILTIKLTPLTQTIKVNQWLNIDGEHLKNGMLFALDKDLFLIGLDNHINGQLGLSLTTLSLLYISYLISVCILLMEQNSNTAEASSTQINETNTEKDKGSKPTIDIVYTKVNLDRDMYFIYNKNDGPNEDSFTSLLLLRKTKLNKAEIEIDGKLRSGILRKYMVPGGNGGYNLAVKPSVYRALVETHNLESNGRNLICRAGSVVIFKND